MMLKAGTQIRCKPCQVLIGTLREDIDHTMFDRQRAQVFVTVPANAWQDDDGHLACAQCKGRDFDVFVPSALVKKAQDAELETILEWVGPGRGPEAYQMWVCRGEKKGCKKRRLKTKRHCSDCFLPDEKQTLDQVIKQRDRGDA